MQLASCVPRSITPVYGFELVITRCRGCSGIGNVFDEYFCRQYGHDAIARSAIHLGEDAYTFVACTPQVAQIIGKDAALFQPFCLEQDFAAYGFDFPSPRFSNALNGSGLSRRPTTRIDDRRNDDTSRMQARIDAMCTQGMALAGQLTTTLQRQGDQIQELGQHLVATTSTLVQHTTTASGLQSRATFIT